MKVTYFYKEGCPYSSMTHSVVQRMVGGSDRQINVQKFCVDENPTGYKRTLSRYCGKHITTFPQIFINDKHIGGYSELARMYP